MIHELGNQIYPSILMPLSAEVRRQMTGAAAHIENIGDSFKPFRYEGFICFFNRIDAP